MELVVAKALSALLLWILSLCFGLMTPYLLWKSRRSSQESSNQDQVRETDSLLSDEDNSPPNYHSTTGRQSPTSSGCLLFLKRLHERIFKYDIASFINCLCGGLFLGICLLELLPESRNDVQEILNDLQIKTNLPVTEFFIAIGLLFVMLVEQSVHFMCLRRRARKSRSYDFVDDAVSTQNGHATSAQASSSEDEQHTAIPVDPCEVQLEDPNQMNEATRAIVLIAMLSVHSVFEGLALGLEASLSKLIQLLVAISVHKTILSFGLGIKLFETFTPHKVTVAVICSFIFCSGSPIGCAIGILLTLNTDKSGGSIPSDITTFASVTSDTTAIIPVTATTYTTAIFECLATGTFLYVTFIEVIPNEFGHSKDEHLLEQTQDQSTCRRPRKLPITPFFKIFALLIGFAAIVGLQFIGPDH